MKHSCYMLIVFSILAGCLAVNDADSLDRLLSRLEVLENKDQYRDIHQQEQDIIIAKLQFDLDNERQLRKNVEDELAKVKQRLDKQAGSHKIGAKDLLYKRQGNNFLETAAFHATLDQDAGLEHITVGSTIPFPNVKLNIGGGYDNATSKFTAPMAGVYILSVSISSYWNDHGELHVGMMKNGVYTAGAYVDDIGGPPEQGSVTVTMQLEVGDEVWIKHVVHDDGALYGGGLTSFTGCLIYSA